ncbi:hypothetical protein Tco_1132547 [Tanacetum coccineum]|uniref:Uncharacterized protein n=1 Tax=Tanacetum coccineum TaxID=301880 RepID=A0ABQ5JC69_9ASTR
MLNRRAKSRITNCDILTRKGPITLKVYREDDSSEIIPEFKASNLQLGKWREVVTACPKKGKQWTSIYKQIQERIDYLRTTEDELRIDLDRPLSEQDPLDRLNDLANKKRKHADDIHDFFRANKRLKTFSSLLLAEIDKRNLNPLKQMRVIEQLTHRIRRLEEYLHFSVCSGTETKEGHLERKVCKAGKRLLYVKRNKAISLGNVTSKVGIEVQQLSSNDCT